MRQVDRSVITHHAQPEPRPSKRAATDTKPVDGIAGGEDTRPGLPNSWSPDDELDPGSGVRAGGKSFRNAEGLDLKPPRHDANTACRVWIRGREGGRKFVADFERAMKDKNIMHADYFDLSSKDLNGESLIAVVSCLQRHASKVSTLDLSRNGVDAHDVLAAVPYLSQMKKLRHLLLQDNALGLDDFPQGRALAALGELTSLRSLDVSGNDIWDLPALCAAVVRLPELKVLRAADNEFIDGGGIDLRAATSLLEVDLSRNPYLRGIGVTLATAPSLQALDLSVTVARPDFSDIRGCPALQCLRVRDVMLGDLSLEFLQLMPTLREFDARSSTLTDAQLRQLESAVQLTTIIVTDTLVTEAAVTSLRLALPEARILT